jgi:periplasmic protein TonB
MRQLAKRETHQRELKMTKAFSLRSQRKASTGPIASLESPARFGRQWSPRETAMRLLITAAACAFFFGVAGCSMRPVRVIGVVWDVDQVDTRPKPIKREPPDFPGEKRGLFMRGQVTIQFVVTTTGQVAEPVVLSSNNDYFTGPAVDAIRRWRFKPAEKEGVPVNCRMQLPMSFSVDGRQKQT